MQPMHVLILCVCLCGCEPSKPSTYCMKQWALRDIVKDMKPISVQDAERKLRILSEAEWCDKHPGGIQI